MRDDGGGLSGQSIKTGRKPPVWDRRKAPPAIPSIPPSALAPSDTANSQNANPLSISTVSRSRSRCCSSCPELAAPDVSQARSSAQGLPGVKEPPLDSANRDAHHARYFLYRIILRVLHLQNPADVGSQTSDCPLHKPLPLLRQVMLFRIRSAVRDFLRPANGPGILRGNFGEIAPSQRNHEGRIDGDSREPCRKA